ncbi:MAG: HD domain-containing protein, partial [Candidatus Bathyarchaeaceae archaeon]
MEKLVNQIKDETLREKVVQFLESPTIEIDGKVYTGMPLDSSPAGLSRHHSYPGGFIEHVVATTEIALSLCNIIKRVYHGKVDRDLVISGAILHDIFKPLTYEMKENGTYEATPLAERLDHLTLIVSEMIRRGFSLDLIHIVCAHHGGEAGPMWPRTIEALVCHLADITDSRLNGEV